MIKALEALVEKGFKTKHGHGILNMDRVKEQYPDLVEESGQMNWKLFEEKIRPNWNIFYRPDKASLTVQLMDRPASEGGKGLQCAEGIELFVAILKELNERFPCTENAQQIRAHNIGLDWDEVRTVRRTREKIEGQNKERS